MEQKISEDIRSSTEAKLNEIEMINKKEMTKRETPY